MSWNNTVRCGHCYEYGHNRASCAALREQYESWLSSDNSYERRRAERYFEKKKRKAERANNRKCSYCSQPGHTKRTCSTRKADVDVYAGMIYEGRERLHKSFHEKGFGVGALISHTTNDWDSDTRSHVENVYLGIVTSIDFDRLSHQMIVGGDETMLSATVTAVSYVNHPKGVVNGRAPLPIRAMDFWNTLDETYDYRQFSSGKARSARIKIVTPLDEKQRGLIPCPPSYESCEKMAQGLIDECGKERWRLPRDLHDELNKRGITV